MRLVGKKRKRKARLAHEMFRRNLRNTVYGSIVATEFLYKKRYRERNASVEATVPAHRLLVMDITRGDGWEKLCPFLGVCVPPVPFPHAHKSDGLKGSGDGEE